MAVEQPDSRRGAVDVDDIAFEDIAPFSGAAPAGAAPAARPTITFGRPSRRQVLRGVGLAGMAMAMQVVGIVPLKRAWAAQRYGYRLVNYPDGRCFDYNCVPGCGPSKVCGATPKSTGNEAYGHCCRRYVDVEGVSPNGFWHRNRDRVTSGGNTRRYRLRPGVCYGADAWIWRVTGCTKAFHGCGKNKRTTFRCHDGWYKLNGADNTPGTARGWTRTICKHRYGCG